MVKTNQRNYLREKRKKEKQKKAKTAIFIAIAIILLFMSIAFLTRFIQNKTISEKQNGFTLGDADAPVEVQIFSNYDCSHCKTFSENQEKVLINQYVNTGKVFYRYINMASGDQPSILASIASYCSDEQDKFFDYKVRLYEKATAIDGFSESNLMKYASDLQLDVEKFTSCLEGEKYSNAHIEDRTYAASVGIKYTPAFFVDGKIVNVNELFPLIDSLLGE
jgi:protein-disulfide isomerase